ncbi:MAG: ubiquitin-like protein Pup [bacterium]|nr:ubiquitin-like protein Pup [bacterium]MXV90084.1 ubiquitin-like protein Pup [Acidimicrobiia bacterium]MYC46486.1 ubiquitin-like protein Pup [Acidimicrobiia bacterium]
MAERERIQKSSRPSSESVPEEEAPTASPTGDRLKAELDDLLDEIDEVLETNAEEFVNSYIQKGGQ